MYHCNSTLFTSISGYHFLFDCDMLKGVVMAKNSASVPEFLGPILILFYLSLVSSDLGDGCCGEGIENTSNRMQTYCEGACICFNTYNATCQEDSIFYSCQCNNGFFSVDNLTCIEAYGSSCESSEECEYRMELLTCNSTTKICECERGYHYPSPVKICEQQGDNWEVVDGCTKVLGSYCSADSDCFEKLEYSVCREGCHCHFGYRPQSADIPVCEPVIGGRCVSPQSCSDHLGNTTCSNFQCTCLQGFFEETHISLDLPYSLPICSYAIGSTCWNSSQCLERLDHLFCDLAETFPTCKCEQGYFNNVTECSKILGNNCTDQGDGWCEQVENARCDEEYVCVCREGYQEVADLCSAIPTTTGLPINTTTTTTTIPPSRPLSCSGTDPLGNTWNATEGQVASKPCPGRTTGKVTWECRNGGFVNPSPDYSDCLTKWVNETGWEVEELIGRGELYMNTSIEFVSNIDATVMDAMMNFQLDHSGNSETLYFGHEIQSILSVLERIIGNVDDADVKEFEALVHLSFQTTTTVLAFEMPWKQLIPKTRHLTMTKLMANLQQASFELSGRQNETYEDTFIAKNKILITSGNLKEQIHGLTFPSDGAETKGRDTFLILPPTWSELKSRNSIVTPNSNSDNTYVGMIIEHQLIRNNFPGSLFHEDTLTFETMDINSKLVSFSLTPDNGTMVEFPDTPLQIVFSHNVASWGNEVQQVKRRLHENESPRAVQGSATCVYWNTKLLVWSTEGCSVAESGQYHTVCECDHLSEFALMVLFHQYVGKPFGLELISITAFVCLTLYKVKTLFQAKNINYITKALIYSILTGNVLLIAFVDRNYFNLAEAPCELVGMATHFMFLSGFLWMTLRVVDMVSVKEKLCQKDSTEENVKKANDTPLQPKDTDNKELDDTTIEERKDEESKESKVEEVKPKTKTDTVKFEDERKNIPTKLTRIYIGVAVGVPLVIVAGTTAIARMKGPTVRAYGNEFCWLDGYTIWAFFGPMFLIVVGNIILILVLYYLSWKKIRYHEDAESFQNHLKQNGALSLIVSITWVFGYFQLGPMYSSSDIVLYAFPVLNIISGFLMCRLNSGVFSGVGELVASARLMFIPPNPQNGRPDTKSQIMTDKQEKESQSKDEDQISSEKVGEKSLEGKGEMTAKDDNISSDNDSGDVTRNRCSCSTSSSNKYLVPAHTPSGTVNVQIFFGGDKDTSIYSNQDLTNMGSVILDTPSSNQMHLEGFGDESHA